MARFFLSTETRRGRAKITIWSYVQLCRACARHGDYDMEGMAEGVREGVVGEERSGRLERRAVGGFAKRRVGGVDRRMVGGLDLSRGRCQKSLSFD